MEKTVEFTGRKVQEAVDEGLKTLGITLDEADIKIISNGGLFKKAKIAIRYEAKEEEVKPAPAVKEAAENPTQKQESKKPEKKSMEKQTPPDGEPHWGTAPVKRAPTTASNFGKGAGKEEVAEEKAPVVAPERKKEKQERGKKQDEKERVPKKQRVSAEPTEEQVVFAKEFLTGLLERMQVEGKAEITVDDGLRVNIETEDSRIIGHRGEVLDSMQQLISSLINTSHGSFVHVTVDGLGYRNRRKDTLESLAQRMADKAVRTHRKVTLDAMNSADRRIVHAALSAREDVFTRSEGHEPARRVAVIPKRK